MQDLEFTIQQWESVPCFFSTSSKSAVPFDIFAASFYLITRYEEYLPHVKDEHQRYPATESVAFQNNFLEKPVIDIWAYKLLALIKEKFPNYSYQTRTYQFISTIDVDHAFAYKYKNLVRSVGGLFYDLFQFKIVNVWERFASIFNIKKDPFDTYDKIIHIKNKYNSSTIFFFLIADYTTFDTNISASKNKFRLLIKSMVDYARVGLHPSYFSMQNPSILKKEKERLEKLKQEKIEKDKALNKKKVEEAERKAIQAQVKQLIKTNEIKREAGDVVFQFSDGKKIKKIYVSQEQYDHLTKGLLAIAVLAENYVLVARAVASKISERDSQAIAYLFEKSAENMESDEDDPYKGFEIPDDLMW